MKANEMREKSESDLNEELLSLLREQFNYRMQKASAQMTQVHKLKNVRRTIARLRTILNEKKAGK